MTDPEPDWANMSPEEFTLALVPNPDDLAAAGGWLAAQTRLDPDALLHLYLQAFKTGRLFHLLVAVGETAVRATGLRDDPAALSGLLAELANRQLEEGNE